MQARVLVIGVGNRYRRDDAAGLLAAARLREAAGASVNVREESGEGTALMQAWEGVEAVILIDAVHSGAPPGTVFRLDGREDTIPAGWFHWSSHAFGPTEAIALARTLDRLPRRLIVFGIEGKTFDAGDGLSAEADRAVGDVVARTLQELKTLGRAEPPREDLPGRE